MPQATFLRPDIVRPPSEWRSYYLPLTAGCSNNTCSFCYYNDCKLSVRDLDEVLAEIDALALFARSGARIPTMPSIVYHIAGEWDGQRVFLQDGDALVYPFPKLVQVLARLNERFPALERVGTYGTPQDILRRTPEELGQLRDLKLGIIYMGLESGDDAVLQAVGKGVDSAQMLAAGRRVKESGIDLSVSVILGLAGPDRSEQHALATARILTEMDPDYVGALTLTVYPGTPMHDLVRSGEFQSITPLQSLTELRLILNHASFSNCFFSSMHASNYFSLRGTLPADKEKMLQSLDAVLSRGDSSRLRPEYLRRL